MDDPILLDSDEEMVNLPAADLNDEQFELVKERFSALLGKYGTLWRAMISEKENSKTKTHSVASAIRGDKNKCDKDDCACGSIESFLPVSLLEKSPLDHTTDPHSSQNQQLFDTHDDSKSYNRQEEEIENGLANKDDSIGYHDRYDEFQKDQGIDEVCDSIVPVTGITDRNESNTFICMNASERLQATYNDKLDYRESTSTDEDSEEENEDSEEEDDDDEDSSAVSTVLQWDDWSDAKECDSDPRVSQKPSSVVAVVHGDENSSLRLNAKVERAAFPCNEAFDEALFNNKQQDKNVHDVPVEMTFGTDEEAVAVAETMRSDSERSWDDGHDNYNNSDTEVEWDGNLKEREVMNVDSDIEDLIEQTEEIEISDSSDLETNTAAGKPNISRGKPNRAFKKVREQLATDLLQSFDQLVCDGRLGESTTVEWSSRLLTTAGRARLGRSFGRRTARIELSAKVLDDEERLRSTLIHEACHAAAFIIDGVTKPPHGPDFKKWGLRAMNKFPDVEVTTTHNYEIQFKYFYTCSGCGYMYKRQSNSLDVKKLGCGKCRGRLFASTEDGAPKKSRPPSAYQTFIRENSAAVRDRLSRNNPNVSQPEVMRECARLWKERKAV